MKKNEDNVFDVDKEVFETLRDIDVEILRNIDQEKAPDGFVERVRTKVNEINISEKPKVTISSLLRNIGNSIYAPSRRVIASLIIVLSLGAIPQYVSWAVSLAKTMLNEKQSISSIQEDSKLTAAIEIKFPKNIESCNEGKIELMEEGENIGLTVIRCQSGKFQIGANHIVEGNPEGEGGIFKTMEISSRKMANSAIPLNRIANVRFDIAQISQIICSNRQSDGRIVRTIRYSNGSCANQVLNSSGVVIIEEPNNDCTCNS